MAPHDVCGSDCGRPELLGIRNTGFPWASEVEEESREEGEEARQETKREQVDGEFCYPGWRAVTGVET
ncbi:MAG: hypothetical protein NVS2B16_34180 [Chloroflexota bacterium]